MLQPLVRRSWAPAGWWPSFTKRSRQTLVGRTLIVRAKFDSAQTTADNRRHWANADGLSADAAANPEVRRTLRNRARYEVANNSYARGIVLTLANDVIGTGHLVHLARRRRGCQLPTCAGIDRDVPPLQSLRTVQSGRHGTVPAAGESDASMHMCR
jgi:hypothetical protein